MTFTWLLLIFFSIAQAFISTVFSVCLALPLAHFFYRYTFVCKRMLLALCSLFFIMPTKLAALAIATCFGASGLPGIVLAHLMLNVPFAVYLIYLSYQKLDLTIIWSARQLGATGWHCYRTIVLPFLLPIVRSTALIIFLLCFSSFSVPLILGTDTYHMTPEIMMSRFYQAGDSIATLGYYLVRLCVVIPVGLLYVRSMRGVKLIRHIGHKENQQRYSIGRHGIAWVFYGLGVAYLTLVPLCALLFYCVQSSTLSFLYTVLRGDVDSFLGVSVLRVIANSCVLALVSSVGSVLIGFFMCRLLFDMKTQKKRLVGVLITIASFIVGSVGLGILFSFFSVHTTVPVFFIAAVCHILLNYPFTYRIIKAQWFCFQAEWRYSAQSLGASHMHQLCTLELPFLQNALRKAWCISFGLSLIEVGAGSVLGNVTGITLPMAIRIYRHNNMLDGVYGLSLIILFIVFMLAYVVVDT